MIFVRRFHKDAAFMIQFDNSLGEGQAQPPSALFGSESGPEDTGYISLGNPLSGIGNVDKDLSFTAPENLYCDGAGVAHGIDCVLAKIFDYPFKKGSVDLCR